MIKFKNAIILNGKKNIILFYIFNSRKFFYDHNIRESVFEVKRSDLDLNLNYLKDICKEKIFFKDFDEIFSDISLNLFQIEYEKEKKLNKFLHCILEIIVNSSSLQKEFLFNNKNLKKIIEKILIVENLRYFDPKSLLAILMILNMKLVSAEELKFLIQFAISEDFNFLKILKYGRNLLKINFGENIIRQLFIKISQIDNSKFPNQVLIEDELLEYLIYAKHLDRNRLDDYQIYLEKYLLKLEKELDNDDEVKCPQSKQEIHKRLIVLKSSIRFLSLKKENPNVKLVSDVLLAYLSQYKSFLDLDHFIILISIMSSDKFLIQYEIKLFKEKFENELIARLENVFIAANESEILEKDSSLYNLIELYYYLDKMYSYNHNDLFFKKISEIILKELKKFSLVVENKNLKEIIEIIEIYISNKGNLFNTLHLDITDYSEKEEFKKFINDMSINEFDDNKDVSIEKIKKTLKFKIFFSMEKKNKENSKFLKHLNHLKEKDELLSMTKNCLGILYYIESNLNQN